MPNIDTINGIKVNIYNGDHRPPHVHFLYNKYEVLLVIETGEIYRGNLPGKQLRKAKEWLMENSDWALQIFYELNPSLQ